ncbi:MAG: DUF3179 domain-containing protein [Nitrospinota bacterium]
MFSPKRLILGFVFSGSLSFSALPLAGAGETLNGFDLSGSLLPVQEIYSGGPPKDGIPAIHNPKFLKLPSASSMTDSDRVLGIFKNGVAKAYPIKILNWHEIVNDTIGKTPVVITYCPLCGTGMAFLSKVSGKVRKFGVSGLLFNSDVLLYDRKTESLWSQILGMAVSGPLKGEKLSPVPLTHTNFGEWKKRHPDSFILSEETGFKRNYLRNPYLGYEKSSRTYFPVSKTSAAFHAKELVAGVEVAGKYKAYPFSELGKNNKGPFTDTFNGTTLLVKFEKTSNMAEVFDKNGTLLPSVTAYWFAWYAFHPETEVFRSTR